MSMWYKDWANKHISMWRNFHCDTFSKCRHQADRKLTMNVVFFCHLSSFLVSVVTDLKDGLFRPNWISWSGSVCTNTKRIIWKMPRKDTRRYDSLSALAIRKWHNNNFHPLETSHYLSPGRGEGGGESEGRRILMCDVNLIDFLLRL